MIAANSSGNIITITVTVGTGLLGQLLSYTVIISGGNEPATFSGNNSDTDYTNAVAFDFGDAPDSYATDASDNNGEGVGVAHLITGSTVYLGISVDAETDANPFPTEDDESSVEITVIREESFLDNSPHQVLFLL